MKKRIIFISLLFLIVCAIIVFSESYDEEGGSSDNPRSTHDWDEDGWPNWYDTEDWSINQAEIDYCENWGGVEDIESGTSGGIKAAADVVDLTITLQGYKTVLHNTTLYEVAWYVQPLTGTVAFTIYFINEEEGIEEEIRSGFGEDIAPDTYYEAIESEINYDKIIMKIERDVEIPDVEGISNNEIKVPFVEKD